MLTTVEKVILLQRVDLFRDIPTEQLALMATIAEERGALEGDEIYPAGADADSMYLVLSGEVRLHQGDQDIVVVGAQEAFGTWALLDDQPRVTSATARSETRLLRIDRQDFVELLADNVQIARTLIRTVAGRLRALAGQVS